MIFAAYIQRFQCPSCTTIFDDYLQRFLYDNYTTIYRRQYTMIFACFVQRFQYHTYTTIWITIIQRFLRFFYNDYQYNDFCILLHWFWYDCLQWFGDTMIFVVIYNDIIVANNDSIFTTVFNTANTTIFFYTTIFKSLVTTV